MQFVFTALNGLPFVFMIVYRCSVSVNMKYLLLWHLRISYEVRMYSMSAGKIPVSSAMFWIDVVFYSLFSFALRRIERILFVQ